MKKLTKIQEQKDSFLGTSLNKDEIYLEYYIGDPDNYELSSPELHKKFKKIYGENLVSKKDLYETQIPEIHSKFYNYKINGLKVQFYSRNPKRYRTIHPTQIYFQGLEKKINKLVENMKKKFRMQAY